MNTTQERLMLQDIAQLREQVAELSENLTDITSAYERALTKFGAHEWGMLTIESARAALAKVKP